jgi:hypothetical protein
MIVVLEYEHLSGNLTKYMSNTQGHAMLREQL